MKKFAKIVGAFVLTMTMFLSGCMNILDGIISEQGEDTVEQSDTESQEKPESLNLNGYTLIRGENEDPTIVAAISEAYTSMMSSYNLDVSFGIDAEIREGDKEIIFGSTNRSVDKNLRYSDYSIDYKNGKIYICGGSGEAIKKAVDWMCKSCVTDGVLSLDKIPCEYNASYSLESLKVFGIPVKDFSVELGEGEADDELYKWLGSRTGMRRVSESGYVIKVVADPTLNFSEIGVELVGKELLLSASAHLGDLTVVTDFFLDAIKTRSSDDLEFNGRDVIEMPENTTLQDVRSVSATTKMVYAETDKDPLSYKVGDDIVFICSLYADKTLVSCPQFSWVANTADGQVYMGEAEGSYGKLIVKIPATSAGDVRIKVLVKDENGAYISDVKQSGNYDSAPVFSVVVNADEVTTKKQEPSDFDAFWAAQVNKVMAVDPDVISMEKVSSPSGIQTLDNAVANASAYNFYRVKIQTPEECGFAVGYLSIPKNAKSLGITVVFNGYGVGDLSPYVSPTNIVLNVCAHSYELGQSSSYYSNLLANYGFTGNESRDKVYFRTMIMRDLQAVRFIKAYAGTEGVKINGTTGSLGVWNGKLRLYGGSQGAFQGIAVAALDKDVTDAYWYIPWMCDIGGTASVFRPTYTDALRYYDTVYFGRRIGENVNVTLTAGLGDYICPPSGVVALFNEMQGNVTLYFKQGMTHGYTPAIAPTTMYQK